MTIHSLDYFFTLQITWGYIYRPVCMACPLLPSERSVHWNNILGKQDRALTVYGLLGACAQIQGESYNGPGSHRWKAVSGLKELTLSWARQWTQEFKKVIILSMCFPIHFSCLSIITVHRVPRTPAKLSSFLCDCALLTQFSPSDICLLKS